MDVKNHNTNRKKRVVRKRWNAAVLIALFVGILLTVFQYLGFVSKTVYEESVSHLTEIFHQSDNMLSELTNKNLTYLHIWGEYLQNTSDESEIREYIEKAQEDAGFLDFYFLSADGNYKMATGETGYLGLQENIEDEIRQGNDVITNATVPGKSQLLVFATPRPHGSYQGFEYDAIAIAYENSDIVNVLNISAFNGNAQSYVVHPDGRVVVDHSSEAWGEVYNFFGILREHSTLSEKEILKLSEEFKEGHTDAMLINLDGEDYYLVYEKSKPQDWIFLGLVQADIVNASMNVLQRSTVLLVSAVAVCIAGLFIGIILRKNRVNLKRKDTEILYRDELFQKLSMNVDDVFLMLDAKTYQADYVSQNVEKLLGITVEQIHKDIYILGIESSCDETAASVVKNGREVLSNVISSQIALHTLYGGVVPEIASRKHIEKINQVIEQALADAHVTLEDITAIAVTYGPGLVGALLVGVSEAKAISFATGIPLVGVHHIEGHISANFIENKELEPPFICLVASGGHSHLVVVKDYGEYEIIGRTRDDAAGEAFDKVARAIGLGYPGGPKVYKLAR